METTDESTSTEQWMIRWIANELGIAENEVGLDEDFDDMGLSSIQAVALAGDLAEQMRVDIEPDIAWEFNTIKKIAAYLSAR